MLLTQGYWSPKFCSKIVKNTINEEKNRFLQPEEKKVSTTAFKFNSTAWFHRGPELIKALLDNACDSNKNLRACRRRLSALLWRKDATRLFFFWRMPRQATQIRPGRRSDAGTGTAQSVRSRSKIKHPVKNSWFPSDIRLVYIKVVCVCVCGDRRRMDLMVYK